MRLLHLTATYPPSINGVAHHVQLLASTQEKLGHQVKVFAPKHPQAPSSRPLVIDYPALPTPIAPDYPVGAPITIPKSIKTFKPQVIHVHHPFNFGYYALHLADHFHAICILTHHTQYQTYSTTYLRRAARPINRLIDTHLKHLYPRLDAIICPNQTIAHQLKQQGSSHTVHIPNGINLKSFRPVSRSHFPPDLISVGRLDREKRPQLLLDLAPHLRSHLSTVHLTLVGGGQLLKTLQARASREGLDQIITFTGPVDRNTIPSLLTQHSLFISYSESEVMPLSYIEALACGLPICVTAPGLIPNLLTSQNSLTLSNSPSAAARQLAHLLKHPQQLTSLSRAAARTARHFDILHTTKQVLDLYQKLMPGNE